MLENKNILITAGPTWAPIDDIRIITNISTGETGYNIARKAQEIGGDVTLLLGPGSVVIDKNYFASIELIRFKYFSELLSKLEMLLLSRKYHIMIHSAAVSDYMVDRFVPGKIRSGKQDLHIFLKPAIKIVDQIRKWAPDIILVKFKLECNITIADMIEIGYKSLQDSNADIIAVNRYVADSSSIDYTCLIDKTRNITQVPLRSQLPEILFDKLNSIITQ